MPVPGIFRRTATWPATVVLLAIACVPSTAAAQDLSAPGTTRLPSPGPILSPSVRRAPPATPVETRTPQILSSKEQRYLIERIDPERTLDVNIGRPTVLRFKAPPFRDQVGDPEVVDVISLTETELSITGKKVGSTVLNLWFKDPHSPSGQEVLSYLVRVSEDPERSRQYDVLLENLERDLNRGFPNSVVDLSYVGSQVVVRGKAKDIEEATNLLRIVSQSLPTDEQSDQSAARSQNPLAPGQISADGVQPTSFQAVDGYTIQEIADAGGVESIFRGETRTGANATKINNRVVNMLEIAGVHQVMLKVTLAEVVRDSGRSLIATTRFGVDSDNTSDISFTHQTGLGRLTFQTEQFFLRFDALKRLGLARSLSEPNLTTLSGQPATFLVGGEFPILESVSTVAAVNQNISYVPFGIQLSVLPTVTDGDRVRLQLQATISERDGDGTGDGDNDDDNDNDPSQPPALTTRTFTSTVELRDTESLALAGLIRSSLNSSSARVPFLGDLPYVGNLFSTKSSDFQEQELLVVVTPYLVSPVPADMPLAIPGSDTFEPDDMEFFIRGALSGSVPEDYRTPVRSDSAKIHAFRCSEQKYIIGLPGHSSGRPLPACPSPANQLLREVP
ncbi:type II and III secretion system protein family protein [Roseimaritima ulvae]|uniref:Type II secretion system protein D n=1 Tax=Roseimaritima ulvae TaxID=980254 RepID=A0A5B9QTY3_9BACT|nr:pilus assembly protein N-terminal domain-containing protein [Roseimaritima ulvae]QEG40865.1 Type II secretion system protein D precursor [Roseimaritima ulvae]